MSRGLICLLLLVPAAACHRQVWAPAPAPATQPVLKTQAQLEQERGARIQAGQITPSSTPVLAADAVPKVTSRPVATRIMRPTPGAIDADVLIVNQTTLTSAEALYSIRAQIEESRRTQTRKGFLEKLERLVRENTQREVGSILMFDQAMAGLADPQKRAVDETLEKLVAERVSREFGDSLARMKEHLRHYGLTFEQFKEDARRQMVVNQYTRELLLPRVQVRREELLTWYRDNSEKYSTPSTRELLLIEAPFDKFLPEGQTWDNAPAALRAQAQLAAVRHIREAAEALATRDFTDVAHQYSRGASAASGGSWGQIGAALQPPYDTLSAKVFDLKSGAHSDPIETATGWYLVGCGRIEPARTRPFASVQDDIREEIADRRFGRLASEYILKLAQKATISSLDTFVQSAIRRASQPNWPDPSPTVD